MTMTTEPQVALMVPVRTLAVGRPIPDVQALADHLHVAAQVELSTIPLYMYALYSIRTDGYSQWSPPLGVQRTLTGIVVEEMLHLALARNLMIAIGHGDAIKFYDPDFIPKFPSAMLNRYKPGDKPTPTIPLHLKSLSTEHVGTFLRVEEPDHVDSNAAYFEAHPNDPGQYTSLGAFYRAIEKAFVDADAKKEIDWSRAQVDKQYDRGFWNQFGGGKPVRVDSLKTAKQALEIIVDQGEGATGDHKFTPSNPANPRPGFEEFSHYEKFLRIKEHIEGIGAGNGEADYAVPMDSAEAVWPLLTDPTVKTLADAPATLSLQNLFNASYCYMLHLLDVLFATSVKDVRKEVVPGTRRIELFSHRYALERNVIAAMQGILYPIARMLVGSTIDAGKFKGKRTGPSFEYYKFDDASGKSKKQQLMELCEKAMPHFPELGGEDGVQRQIRLIVDA
ncbi:ferritin-like protein [Spirillospora sp. NPDC029432]|uniref:ferritin-like domain-containing protein n=1 Tax=Spirillospora sp. NPDC029432 TaxID=3154599 RepID=UPI003451B5AC